jgi:hypothetical protein
MSFKLRDRAAQRRRRHPEIEGSAAKRAPARDGEDGIEIIQSGVVHR